MIKRGQLVQIKPEWQDKGDEKFTWIALSDEENGRVDITPLGTGLAFPPVQTVAVFMLEQGEKK